MPTPAQPSNNLKQADKFDPLNGEFGRYSPMGAYKVMATSLDPFDRRSLNLLRYTFEQPLSSKNLFSMGFIGTALATRGAVDLALGGLVVYPVTHLAAWAGHNIQANYTQSSENSVSWREIFSAKYSTPEYAVSGALSLVVAFLILRAEIVRNGLNIFSTPLGALAGSVVGTGLGALGFVHQTITGKLPEKAQRGLTGFIGGALAGVAAQSLSGNGVIGLLAGATIGAVVNAIAPNKTPQAEPDKKVRKPIGKVLGDAPPGLSPPPLKNE